jgi:hypothetical protein
MSYKQYLISTPAIVYSIIDVGADHPSHSFIKREAIQLSSEEEQISKHFFFFLKKLDLTSGRLTTSLFTQVRCSDQSL